MPTTTLQAIYRATLDRLYPERYIRYGTATATSTTTLTDATQFLTSFTQESHLIGAWIRIATATTVEYAQIKTVAAGTGVITFDRTLTAAVTGALSYAITYERSPAHIDMVIDQVLRNTYTPRMFPLTSVILTDNSVYDNDMETSTATAWSSISAGAPTKAAISPTFPHGTQMLQVAALVDDGARTNSPFLVYAGQQYHASIMAASKVNDACKFQIYDVTNAAAIEDATTAQEQWVNLNFDFTPPSGCKEIYARLLQTIDGTSYWKDLSIVRTDQDIFMTPDSVIWPKQMLGVFEMPEGPAGPGGDNEYIPFSRPMRPIPWSIAYNTPQGTNELAIQVPGYNGNQRYIYAMAPASALSLDTSTTFLDPDSVASSVVKVLKEQEPLERVLDEVRRTTLKSHHKIAREPAYAHFE